MIILRQSAKKTIYKSPFYRLLTVLKRQKKTNRRSFCWVNYKLLVYNAEYLQIVTFG